MFVYSCAGTLALLSLVTIAKGIIKPDKSAFFTSLAERNRVLTGLAILAGYLLLMPYLGFVLSSFCFYFVMHSALRDEHGGITGIVRTLVLSGVVITVMYLLFHHVLSVPLPSGLW